MTVQEYIRYVKDLDSKMIVNTNNVDLNDNVDNLIIHYSEDKNSRIIDLNRKIEVV